MNGKGLKSRFWNKTTITVTQALSQSPISKEEALMSSWIYDEKKWNDVFAVKPYEYLSIISKGEIPCSFIFS